MAPDTDARWPAEPSRVRRSVRTSLLLESCAVARGLHTMRVGPQAFLGGADATTSDLGFRGSISLETSRVAVRVCADRIVRKVTMTERDVTVPRSRTFARGQADQAAAYAEALGYPVLVRPRARFPKGPLREPAPDAQRLRDDLQDRADRGRPGSAMVVEQWVPGPVYSFAVVGDRVVSVVRKRRRQWVSEVYRSGAHGFGDVHPEVLDLAVCALHALPSVPHGVVHIRCPDLTEPPGTPPCVVVSVDAEIGLIARRPPSSWSLFVAEQMVAHAARHVAKSDMVPADLVHVRFVMSEVTDRAAMVRDVRRWISAREVEGDVDEGSEDQAVVGRLTGAPGAVTMLSGLAATGRLGARAPQAVTLHAQQSEEPW